MTKKNKIYSGFHKATAVFLMLMLFWLTISTPFVWASQQELAKEQKMSASEAPAPGCEDEDSSSGGIEEKMPNTSSLTEEFLHDTHHSDYFFSIISSYHKLENADSYQAFHGELLVPPPNRA